MLDRYIVKNYKKYGRGPGEINRKTWIKNWKEELFWSRYLDVDEEYVKNAVTEYCEANDIQFEFDCGCFYCISNRKQFNDIYWIMDSILEEYRAS